MINNIVLMNNTEFNDFKIKNRFDNFNKKAIKILNEIIEKTDAEIVVSSDWKRWATVEELGDYYKSQGIIKRPIDSTAFCRDLYNDSGAAHLKDEDINWNRTWLLEQERHVEILHWLKQHPEVTHWVAIDDLNMAKNYENIERTWGLENFVLTYKQKLLISFKAVNPVNFIPLPFLVILCRLCKNYWGK